MKNKIKLILVEEKICKKLKKRAMNIINYEKKEKRNDTTNL